MTIRTRPLSGPALALAVTFASTGAIAAGGTGGLPGARAGAETSREALAQPVVREWTRELGLSPSTKLVAAVKAVDSQGIGASDAAGLLVSGFFVAEGDGDATGELTTYQVKVTLHLADGTTTTTNALWENVLASPDGAETLSSHRVIPTYADPSTVGRVDIEIQPVGTVSLGANGPVIAKSALSTFQPVAVSIDVDGGSEGITARRTSQLGR